MLRIKIELTARPMSDFLFDMRQCGSSRRWPQ
jgi:hypothetical protein